MTVKKTANLVTSLAILAGVGLIYRESQRIEVATVHAYGPNFFPGILMGALALLAVALAFQSIDFKGEKTSSGSGNAPVVVNKAALVLQSVFVAFLILYLIVMPYFGYAASTVLFLFASMALLGERVLKSLAFYALTACAVTGALYYVFGEILLLFLP